MPPNWTKAVALAEEFTGLIRDHVPDRFDPSLQRAGNSAIRQLRGFAKRLWADYDAVRAGVALGWSNGQTEEQVIPTHEKVDSPALPIPSDFDSLCRASIRGTGEMG